MIFVKYKFVGISFPWSCMSTGAHTGCTTAKTQGNPSCECFILTNELIPHSTALSIQGDRDDCEIIAL